MPISIRLEGFIKLLKVDGTVISSHGEISAAYEKASKQKPGTYKIVHADETVVVTADAVPAPAPSPAQAPSPAPAPAPAPGPSGIVTDKLPHPMQPLAKPALLVPYKDPAFGQKVVRITDTATQHPNGEYTVPAYSTVPAWNCIESLMILYVPGHGHVLYDGQTYAFKGDLEIEPADIEHFVWHTTNPDVVMYPYNHEMSGKYLRQLISHNVRTNVKTVAFDFNPNNTDRGEISLGSDPMMCSWDMDLWGFRHETKGAFTLRLSTGERSPYILLKEDDTVQAAQMSPSGRYYVVGSKLYSQVANNAYLRDMKITTHEHGCMGQLANGQDVWVAVQFDKYEGTVVMENLDNGVVTTVVGPTTGYPYPPAGVHISAIAYKKPGWISVTMLSEDTTGQGVLEKECLRVDLNTGRVERLCHVRSTGKADSYWSEPHGVISPNGSRILFGSDFGSSSTIDSYICDMR